MRFSLWLFVFGHKQTWDSLGSNVKSGPETNQFSTTNLRHKSLFLSCENILL